MKKKVLITVKTYPTLSKKYNELVCTAGFLEDGSWIRIYPVAFRKKAYNDQYRKYDWVEVDLVKNTSDFRKESYRPVDSETSFVNVGHIDTKNNWAERKSIILQNVYTDMEGLIQEAQDESIGTSLAVFKPTKVLDFIYEEVEREWDASKLASLKQFNLFETVDSDNEFEVVKKLPFKFSYVFEDINGKKSKMMIEDWETGQLFWNCFGRTGDEKIACEQVKQKYLDDFAKKKDLHFYLGTTKKYHGWSHNPFVIIGTFTPKIELQTKLF
ncbi:hypothetical protein ACXIHB_07385 [Tenacibaculum sp. IMCC1]|uniref:Uncharacterized protein n=1 Tax=Tenacibaculum sp. Pbs-1 TaxID=3238748 RepID=A0AB33L052_9FLAO